MYRLTTAPLGGGSVLFIRSMPAEPLLEEIILLIGDARQGRDSGHQLIFLQVVTKKVVLERNKSFPVVEGPLAKVRFSIESVEDVKQLGSALVRHLSEYWRTQGDDHLGSDPAEAHMKKRTREANREALVLRRVGEPVVIEDRSDIPMDLRALHRFAPRGARRTTTSV